MNASIGMFKGHKQDISQEQGITLPEMTMAEHVVYDYSPLALSQSSPR